MLNRAIVFVHYDKDNLIDDYVYFYLKELQKVSDYIVFVTVVKLSINDINKLNTICNDVILRENVGYDFMSYKVGLESFDYQIYDEVVICNDSVYGPLYPLENIFNKMSTKRCNFWGMTSGKEISYHLQSYFIVFKKQILHSEAFQSFWDNVQVLDNKRDIIEKYEIGLTKYLISYGFKPLAYADYKPKLLNVLKAKLKRITLYKVIVKLYILLRGKYKLPNPLAINLTHQYWKELLIYKQNPFIKIELLRDNPVQVKIDDYQDVIKSISNYDIRLIDKHLKRVKA